MDRLTPPRDTPPEWGKVRKGHFPPGGALLSRKALRLFCDDSFRWDGMDGTEGWDFGNIKFMDGNGGGGGKNGQRG